MKYLIVNADDFGYSYGINRGILDGHKNGIVTSTSVMVDAIAAHEASELAGLADLSVGLHFVPGSDTELASELDRQAEKFVEIVGRKPDHLDVHKVLRYSEKIRDVLSQYSTQHRTPVRQLGFAKFIDSFFAPHANGDVSVAQLKRAIDQATDTYNEMMCHVGYADDYLRAHSSYSDFREKELKTICDPTIKTYIKDRGIELCTWNRIKV